MHYSGGAIRQRMSQMGLGCVKTRLRGKLIEQIALRIAISAIIISQRDPP
jgi:hypothetical protein